jgi:DNA-binding HxlR family transcriptional regulator
MPSPDCLSLPEDRRSSCPISSTLDLLGDKWTLLVVRDLLFLRRRRFGEFLESPERIPTNILADRLRRLEEHGVVEKTLYQQHPRRHEYRLTARGADLFPVLGAIAEWGLRHLPGTAAPPKEVLLQAYERARHELEEQGAEPGTILSP